MQNGQGGGTLESTKGEQPRGGNSILLFGDERRRSENGGWSCALVDELQALHGKAAGSINILQPANLAVD